MQIKDMYVFEMACLLTHASLSIFTFSTKRFRDSRTSGIPPGVALTLLKSSGERKKKQESVIYARRACDGVKQVFSAPRNHRIREI